MDTTNSSPAKTDHESFLKYFRSRYSFIVRHLLPCLAYGCTIVIPLQFDFSNAAFWLASNIRELSVRNANSDQKQNFRTCQIRMRTFGCDLRTFGCELQTMSSHPKSEIRTKWKWAFTDQITIATVWFSRA